MHSVTLEITHKDYFFIFRNIETDKFYFTKTAILSRSQNVEGKLYSQILGEQYILQGGVTERYNANKKCVDIKITRALWTDDANIFYWSSSALDTQGCVKSFYQANGLIKAKEQGQLLLAKIECIEKLQYDNAHYSVSPECIYNVKYCLLSETTILIKPIAFNAFLPSSQEIEEIYMMQEVAMQALLLKRTQGKRVNRALEIILEEEEEVIHKPVPRYPFISKYKF